MPRVSAAFFLFGVLCVLTGMLWGMQMGASENFALMPAHAHLNLIGFVTMCLYGTFYALTAQTMSPRLAWTNFVISVLGVLILIPHLAIYLATGEKRIVPYMAAGEALTVLGMLVFLISVVREFFRKRG